MTVVWKVFLPLCIAYATALIWVWQRWTMEGSYFSHGPLVPLVGFLVVWMRRRQWRARPAVPDLRGLWLLVPALVLHLCGAALTIDSLSAASLVLAVPGAALLALGRQRLRGLWPVLWLPVLAMPLPIFVTGRVAFTLKEVAVDAGVRLAGFLGLGVERVGALVHVEGADAPLLVADPCGGLRSLLAMVTLAYCLAFFLGGRSVLRRVGLLLAAGPIAVVVNVIRIAGLCWVASVWGADSATGTGHDLVNAGAWILDLVLLLALDRLLSRGGAEPAATPEPEAAADRTLPTGVPAALWMLSVPLLALSLWRPFTESAGRAEALPATVGRYRLATEHEITPRYRELLGTGDACWRTYAAEGLPPIYLVAVFHDANWKSMHPPHICIQGSNMHIVEDEVRELPLNGDAIEVGRLVAHSRDRNRAYLSLFTYGAADLTTGSYSEFFWHHSPRALFRRSTAGFLLRVETFVGEEGEVAAQQRCQEFLLELLPAARGLLP